MGGLCSKRRRRVDFVASDAEEGAAVPQDTQQPPARAAVGAWLAERGEAGAADAVCKAFRDAGVPAQEWQPELAGLEAEGMLEQFLGSVSSIDAVEPLVEVAAEAVENPLALAASSLACAATCTIEFAAAGKLGIVFPKGVVPLTVDRVQPEGLAAAKPELQPGMTLTAVQGRSVAGLSYGDTLAEIKAVGRPLTLSFVYGVDEPAAEPGPSGDFVVEVDDRAGSLDVRFEGPGKLGIVFPKGVSPLTVSRIQPTGLAAAKPELQPGMALTAVQGRSVIGLPYADTMEEIKAAGRPLTLSFAYDDVAGHQVLKCNLCRGRTRSAR